MTMPKALEQDRIRDIYDHFGARQDDQAWYEDEALAVLLRDGGFEGADVVVEFGCGTGRFAEMLLKQRLGPQARYVGVDISRTMVDLARKRLEPWGERAQVRLSEGDLDLPAADVIVATYVLDLLSEEDIDAFLEAARAALKPGGRLCIAGLTSERGALNRLWSVLYRLIPATLGGCRPMALGRHLRRRRWTLRTAEIVSTFGLASEAVVASPRD
ncbi:MAG TPA: class I SAM-dependent methyltransferase [Alphaproteobacteria bacterium]|nr:class I SAM-dependent methyltransferase [Alphaproteobacteria bacterium]